MTVRARSRVKSQALPDPRWRTHAVTAIVLTAALLLASSCGEADPVQPVQPVSGEEGEQIKAALQDRSFRQFDPSLDASPRKGIVIDFFGGVSLWAQYSSDGHAVSEWEISAADYRLEKAGGAKFQDAEYVIHFEDPESRQEFPDKCDDCIPTKDLSISVRSVLDSDRISFKLNDPRNSLPSPFPVFESWTRFREDEILD